MHLQKVKQTTPPNNQNKTWWKERPTIKVGHVHVIILHGQTSEPFKKPARSLKFLLKFGALPFPPDVNKHVSHEKKQSKTQTGTH